MGTNLVPFKPHAGISYWNQFDTFQMGLRESMLICSDIVELEQIAKSGFPYEILNPVNRLSRPIYDKKISNEDQVFQAFLAERFTHQKNVSHENVYYLNGTINLNELRDMKNFLQELQRRSERLYFIQDFHELLNAYINNFENATLSCYNHIRNRPLIIESFNDAAVPFARAEECDKVLCVSSNLVIEFEPTKYFQVVRLKGKKKTQLQLTVSDIFMNSLTENRYRVQPLTSHEREDPQKIRQCYSEIITDLL